MDTATPIEKRLIPKTSDVLFRKLFYESKDLLLIYDFQIDKAIDVNESTLKFSGYSREEFMQLSRYDLSPKYSDFNPGVDLHDTYLDIHANKVINGESILELGIFKKKDGSEVFADLEIIPTGRKIGEAFISIKDVTKTIKKKSLYEQSERNFRSIVETTGAGITIVDLSGKHLYVSPGIKEINGYTPEEMMGTRNKYFTKEATEQLVSWTGNLLKGDHTIKSLTLEGVHKDGHSVWVHCNMTLVKDESGTPIAVQTLFIDVSDKILLEQELETTKSNHQKIIESLQGIFIMVDLDGLIEYVSPNYSAIIGYEASEVIGKKGLFIFSDEAAKEIREHSLKLIKGEASSYTSTYKAYHKDGTEIWVSGTFSLIRDNQGEPSGFVSVYLDQTQKILTEKELEKTKYKYQYIIENLDGVISISDMNGITTYISPKITDVLGYLPEEITGKPGIELFFESEHKNLFNYAQQLAKDSSKKLKHTYKGKHKDGSVRWINGVASLMKNGEGEAIGFVSIFFDISHERALQQKLNSSEDKYQILFENAIDPIIVRDLKTFDVIDCNKAALDFFNIDNKENKELLNDFALRVSNDAGESFKEIIKIQLQKATEESLATFQVNYLNEDGKKFIIELNLTIDSSDQEFPKCVFFLKDITERVLAFDKITKERELLNAVIEGTSDQIIVQDKDRKVIAVNTNFKKRFEAAHGTEIGIGTDMKKITSMNKFINFGDKQKWESKINSVLEGKTILHQYSQNLDNEKKHYSLSASPLKNNDKIAGIIGAVRDITEIVKKNEEIEEKNKELQKYLDSNIQLENFAYIASHDLKQPLRTIISFSELLHSKKASQLDEDANTYLNFILESSQRLNMLISDMLAYSVIGTAGEKEDLDPALIIDQVLSDLSLQISQKNAQIIIRPLPTSIMVYKSEFISLIQNLVSNSIKYARDNVVPEIKIDSTDEGSFWQFTITDNGMGIKSEHLYRIFGMFQRLEAHSKTSGTGIGLAHCKKILELHQGKIWAESKVGIGSTFIFNLPK